MDIVDTPGISTKVDFKEFMNTWGLTKEESKKRQKKQLRELLNQLSG